MTIDLESAHRHAAMLMRQTAAIRDTQAREHAAVGAVARSAECERLRDELLAVAQLNEDAAQMQSEDKTGATPK